MGVTVGNKYLNKNVRFKCQSGNAVWFKPQNGAMKVKVNGNEVLLENCKLSLIGGPHPGQCQFSPNPTTGVPPGPCVATIVSGMWNNTSKNVTVGGSKVLLDNCSVKCPMAANVEIKPFKPTIKALSTYNGAKVENVNIEIAKDDNEKSSSANSSELKYNNVSGKESSIVGDSPTLMEKNQNSKDKNKDKENSSDEIKYVLCDYKNCNKAKECQYLKTSYTLKETNESKNAEELKTNMGKDTFDLYAGECGKIVASSYGSYMYSIAHHHIIPVNQCFKSFAEIVKLANYYNYNINKAENGISLPTMNLGYDKESFEIKKEIAFNAMKKSGRQWHKGGHRYSCRINADLDSILQRPFYHYKDAVDKELSSFSIKLTDEMKCRCENYDQQAEAFTKIMDHICAKIAKKLRRFEDDAKKSYPYYVSKLAFYYSAQEELHGYEKALFGEDE